MKKRFGVILALSALLLLTLTSVALADTYPYLTFQDSSDFTVVKKQINYEQITAVGLDGSFQKQQISDPQNITWTTSNSSVAYVYPTSGATVTVFMLAAGEATVTASYTCDDSSVITCSANIVSERLYNPDTTVTGIDVLVEGDSGGSGLDFNYADLEVPLFDLNTVFGGDFNDNDVLTKDVTALHALLYALELHEDDDNYVWGDGGWDWDWVPNNVTITTEGSYVEEIDGDISGWPVGWKFKVDNYEPTKASSIVRIGGSGEPTDVKWEFRQ